ncbi:MAG: hypothetical protein AB8F74_19095 [Saprospiraceae bacterium]
MKTKKRIINGTSLLVQFATVENGFNHTDVKTLSPGQASLISAADPSLYLVRDAHSQQFLSIRQPSELPTDLLISDENLTAKNIGAPVKVEIKNTTKAAIEVCLLDGISLTGKKINASVAKLNPSGSLTVDAKANQIYAARIHTSGSFFQTFLVGKQQKQSFNISLRSKNSAIVSSLSVSNNSTLTLVLQWIDFDGTLRRAVQIKPGGKTKQDTFLSHPWILRDAHSGIIVDACVANHENKKWIFKANKLRSIGNTKATTVEFWNAAPYPVQLIKNDFSGKKTRLDVLMPGARRFQPTHAGVVWEMRDNENFELIKTFLPSPRSQQICRIIPRDTDYNLPPNFTLENKSGLTIDLFAKDHQGIERHYATLSHRAIHLQPTTTADKWFIKDHISGRLIEELISTSEEFTHTITAGEIFSTAMDTAVDAEFINTTPFYVDVSWVDYDGVEEHYYRLRPNEKLPQETHATHVWRFRERETGDILHLFVAKEEANQQVEIVMRPIHSREPAVIRFRNHTGLTVEVLWFDKEGKPKTLRTLIPGHKAAFRTFASHAWAIRDKASGTVLQTTIAKAGKQTFVLNNALIRSKRSDRGTKLIFKNDMPFAVDIHWIDYEGAETPHETLRSGDTLEKNSYTTHPYRFRHHVTKQEVTVFLPTEAARQHVDIVLRAYEDRIKTSVEVRNMTTLTAMVFKVDHEGNEDPLFELLPRDGKKITTFSTHPIIVRDKLSNEPIAFTIASDRPQILAVDGEMLRSNRTEYPVWINWKNTLKLPVELFWVKYDGIEELKRTLKAGESFEMSTYPSHVWRARFKRAGTEVDLYIAGEKDKQTRKIGAAPPLRTREREGGVLWPGEVALYEDIEYKGRVWIAHGDLPDFSILSGFDNTVSSIKVAQDTAVAVFEDSYFNALPQNMDIMAREVKATVEKTFKDVLIKFKEATNNAFTNMKAGKESAFIEQVNAIEKIINNAGDQSPAQVGKIIEYFVSGRLPNQNERLSSLTVDHDVDILETELRNILKERSSTEDRDEFAEAVKAAIWDTQIAIFEAVTTEWESKLGEEIRVAAASALDNLGKFLERAAESAGKQSGVLVQKAESDVFHVDVVNLEGKDIGDNAMSSIRVLRNVSPDTLRISSTNKVVDDPQMVEGKLLRKPTFRTTINFPVEVKEVQLWGTEEMTVFVGGQSYNVGPKDDQFARIKPSPGGVLIIQVVPDRIGISPLMMRTNSMPANSRVFIFPDADVHRKLVSLDDKAFVNGVPDDQSPGGVRQLATKQGVENAAILGAQKAIQTLSRTAAAATTVSGTGTSADRKLVTGRMDMSAFRLDFGSAGDQAADSNFRPVDPATIREQAEGAESLGQGIFDDIGGAIVSVGVAIVDVAEDVIDEAADFIEDTANAIADGFEDLGEALEKGFEEIGDAFEAAGEWIEGAIEDGVGFMEDVIEEAAEFLEDVGSAIADAAEAFVEGVSKGLQIIVETASKVVTVIVDTIEKVGEVVMYIVEKVVEVVESIIDFICALFAWGDILDTQEWIMKLVDKSFEKTDKTVEVIQGMLETLFDKAQGKIAETMTSVREHLGVEEPVEKESESDTSDAIDALMWLFDKISVVSGGAASVVSNIANEIDLPTVRLGPDVRMPSELESALQEAASIVFDLLTDIADDGVDAVVDSFNSIFNRLKTAINDPGRAPQLILAMFVDIAEVFLRTGLSIVSNIADAVLSLFRILLKVIKIVIDTEINIPFVTELYEFITGGQALTIKSMFSLLIAIPVTVLSKLILGNEGFNRMKVAQQVGDDSSLGLFITYGFSHVLLSLLGALSDIGIKADDFKKVDGPVLLSGGIAIFSLLAIGTSIPYYNNGDFEGVETSEITINMFCWAMQIVELIPFTLGVCGLASLKNARTSDGRVRRTKSKNWKSAKAKKDKRDQALSAITSTFGVTHLMLNIVNLSTVGVKGEKDQFSNGQSGDAAAGLMGVAYVATTVPVILEVGVNVKSPYVKAVVIGARTAFHIVEAAAMFSWAAVRNESSAKS